MWWNVSSSSSSSSPELPVLEATNHQAVLFVCLQQHFVSTLTPA